MKCIKCSGKSSINGLCKEHFIEYFENTAKEVIEKHIPKGKRVMVAVSGGKDSITILYLLNKFGYNPEALAIDEGISGYREKTLEELRNFCTKYDIRLTIKSFKDEFGYSLDEIVKKLNLIPCTPCGILRRYLLNKYSKGYDFIATGHNMDDEVQAFMMNIMKNNINLIAKQGILTGTPMKDSFTQRIKPLIMLSEKEVRAYTFMKGFGISFVECNYVRESFRNYVRDWLNDIESKSPGVKRNLLKKLLYLSEKINPDYGDIKRCRICGQPSKESICMACNIIGRLDEEQ